jgi:hypothetical protein
MESAGTIDASDAAMNIVRPPNRSVSGPMTIRPSDPTWRPRGEHFSQKGCGPKPYGSVVELSASSLIAVSPAPVHLKLLT